MMSYIRTLRTLISYILVSTILISPIGWYYLICGIGCFFRSTYCLKVWLSLDITACTTVHNTERRTISGYTGERLHLKRYKLQAGLIDFLARLVGDSKDHCLRAYLWEASIGVAEPKSTKI